jgi:hypothetical protein
MKNTGWSQTKIHKFEAGKLTRVLVDDVFEVALALDSALSPDAARRSRRGRKRTQGLARRAGGAQEHGWWPRPCLSLVLAAGSSSVGAWSSSATHLGDYRTDEEARSGHRFYLLESQPVSEWELIST